MKRLTLREQLRFYLNWCNDNKMKASDYKSLTAFLKEIEEMDGSY